jgi:hypothetical protein
VTATPEDCRRESAECRDQAAKALNPTARAVWLRLADEWEKLAAAAALKQQSGKSS